MKHFLIIVLSLGIFTADAQDSAISRDHILLNGGWKFNTVFGDGSNYKNIREGKRDLVIDNKDKYHVTIYGNWISTKISRNNIPFRGDDFLQLVYRKDSTNAFVRYNAATLAKGYYNLFVRFPFSPTLTVRVTIKHTLGRIFN